MDRLNAIADILMGAAHADGRLNGKEGLRAMCNIKSVLGDRLPMHNPVWLYPVKPGDYDRAKQTIEMLYRRNAGQRVAGFAGLVRSLFRK